MLSLQLKSSSFFYERVIKNILLSKNETIERTEFFVHVNSVMFSQCITQCIQIIFFYFLQFNPFELRMTLSLNKPVVMQQIRKILLFCMLLFGYYIITDFFHFVFIFIIFLISFIWFRMLSYLFQFKFKFKQLIISMLCKNRVFLASPLFYFIFLR